MTQVKFVLELGRTGFVALLGWCMVSCAALRPQAEPEPNPRFPLIVQARDEAGQLLANVELQDGKKVVGRTAASGRAELSLSGLEGQIVDLTVACPQGYSAPGKPISVGLRRLSEHSPAPVFETLCVAQLHSVLVGVRAERGAKLSILYLKRRVAETDSEGVAHFVLRVPPAQTITLTLDTTESPSLRPRSPTLTFVAAERDEIVLFEQQFSLQVQRPKVTRKASGPIRI